MTSPHCELKRAGLGRIVPTAAFDARGSAVLDAGKRRSVAGIVFAYAPDCANYASNFCDLVHRNTSRCVISRGRRSRWGLCLCVKRLTRLLINGSCRRGNTANCEAGHIGYHPAMDPDGGAHCVTALRLSRSGTANSGPARRENEKWENPATPESFASYVRQGTRYKVCALRGATRRHSVRNWP